MLSALIFPSFLSKNYPRSRPSLLGSSLTVRNLYGWYNIMNILYWHSSKILTMQLNKTIFNEELNVLGLSSQQFKSFNNYCLVGKRFFFLVKPVSSTFLIHGLVPCAVMERDRGIVRYSDDTIIYVQPPRCHCFRKDLWWHKSTLCTNPTMMSNLSMTTKWQDGVN